MNLICWSANNENYLQTKWIKYLISFHKGEICKISSYAFSLSNNDNLRIEIEFKWFKLNLHFIIVSTEILLLQVFFPRLNFLPSLRSNVYLSREIQFQSHLRDSWIFHHFFLFPIFHPLKKLVCIRRMFKSGFSPLSKCRFPPSAPLE